MQLQGTINLDTEHIQGYLWVPVIEKHDGHLKAGLSVSF